MSIPVAEIIEFDFKNSIYDLIKNIPESYFFYSVEEFPEKLIIFRVDDSNSTKKKEIYDVLKTFLIKLDEAKIQAEVKILFLNNISCNLILNKGFEINEALKKLLNTFNENSFNGKISYFNNVIHKSESNCYLTNCCLM